MADSPITSREKDFAAWYQDVVLAGDMAEPAEIVKGCMVIKPNGYAVWEILQRELDNRFKATGHQNIYLPLLIPQSFLEKEAEHVKGFAPELAVVTIAGGKKLEEPYVIRPTSETLVGHFFAKWIQSYRDLPVLVNQWANPDRKSPSRAARSWRSLTSSARHRKHLSATFSRSGFRAIATCRCWSINGPTSFAGSCARACFCAPRSSSGRKATRRIPITGRRWRRYSASWTCMPRWPRM